MSSLTSWQSQTRWLSDLTYESDKAGGIWRDKMSRKRDLRPQVTDRDVIKAKALRTPQGVRRGAAVVLVDRLLRMMPADRANAVSPRDKWDCVQLLVDRQGAEVLRRLTA